MIYTYGDYIAEKYSVPTLMGYHRDNGWIFNDHGKNKMLSQLVNDKTFSRLKIELSQDDIIIS